MRHWLRQHKKTRRTLKSVGVLLSAVLILTVAAAVLLSLPAVRRSVLSEALRRADAALPGRLSVGRAAWPALGEFELTNVLWTDGPDTLLAAPRLLIELEPRELRQRDLHLRRLLLAVTVLDVPGLQARLQPTTSSKSAAPTAGGGVPLLRVGALDWLPSLAADSLALDLRGVRLEGGSLRLRLDGGADLRAGRPVAYALDADGAATLAGSPPLSFSLQASGPDSLRLSVDAGARAALAGRLTLPVSAADGADFALSLQLPGSAELATLPALAAALATLPDLAGPRLDLSGRAVWTPTLAVEVTLSVQPTPWCEGGRAEAAWRDGVLDLAQLELRLPDLTLTAAGRAAPDSLALQADLAVRGTRWLALTGSTATAPDSLRADLALHLDGTPALPHARAHLTGRLQQGGLALDVLDLNADVPPGTADPATVTLRLQAQDLVLDGALSLSRGDTLRAELTPLRLSVAGTRVPVGPPPGRRGRATLVPAGGSLTLDGVRATGALGELELSGGLDAERGGRLDLAWRWPQAPAALLQRLDVSPAVADSIRTAWSRDGVPAVAITTDLAVQRAPDGSVGARRLDFTGTLDLPGPRALAALLPAAGAAADLGPLRGRLRATATLPTGGQASWSGWLDLGGNGWLSAARAVAHGRGAAAVLDSLRLTALDLDLSGSGAVGADSLSVAATARLSGTELLRRFAPDLPADLVLDVSAALQATGTTAAPAVALEVSGSAAAGAVSLPRLEARARWRDGRLTADVQTPEGLDLGPDHLDRVTVTAASVTAGAPLPVRLGLDLAGPQLALAADLTVTSDSLLVVAADSLRLRVRDQELRSEGPFEVSVAAAARRLDIRDLVLSGSMGRVSAHGGADPLAADLEVAFALNVPPRPALLTVPDGLWPATLTGTLDVSGPRRLRLGLSSGGLSLGDRDDLTLALTASAGDSVAGTVDLQDGDGTALLGARFTLPAGVQAYPPQAVLGDGPLSAEITLQALPLPLVALHAAGADVRQASLDGRLRLGGTPSAPVADGWLQLGFPTWPKLSRYRLGARLRLGAGDGAIAAMAAPGLERVPDLPPTQGAGLGLSVALLRGDERLLQGTAAWPLTVSLQPPAVTVPPDGPVFCRLSSGLIPVAEFDPLLPAGVGAEGQVRLDFSADGTAAAPRYDGSLEVPRLKVETADGSRVQLAGRAAVTGVGRRPVLRGTIEVQQGVLRVPEAPQNLLPAQGAALLREPLAAPVDSAAVPTAPRPLTAAIGDTTAGPALIDADLSLTIPGGLWLRGQGLEVELSGDLKLRYQQGTPALSGELRAVRGFYSLLGRTFTIERGQVGFYGDDELNPTLDLALSTRLAETLFRVQFTGTLLEPVLALTSEPEMPEGDIMAFLLFGRPLDELSGDQLGLVQQRATDLMAAFGTAELEARLSQQLGVDMLQIGRGRGQAEGTSLVIGKYLSRRVLLKYEQTLDQWSAFFINLEYYLSRDWKLETLLSREGQSGVEVNWGREY